MATDPILLIDQVAPTQIDKVPAINDQMQAVIQAEEGQLTVDMSGGDVTLSDPLQYRRYKVFICTGLTASRNLVVALAARIFMVQNKSSSHNVVVGGVTGATVTVSPLTTVEIQNDGTNCFLAVQGSAGPSGDAGGGMSIAYTFDSTTTNADPGNGNLRLNNSTESSSTAIYADLLSSDGTDYTAILDDLDAAASTEKGIVRLFKATDQTKWIIASLTSRTTHTGYREFAITVIGSSGTNPFTNGDPLILSFTRTGNAATGVTNVWSAAQRSVENVLTFGSTVTPDFSASNNYVLTLTGNCTIANPTNMPASGDDQAGQILVIMDATGGWTLSWGSDFKWPGGSAVPPASGANQETVYSYFARGSTNKIYLSPAVNFS